MSLPDVRLQLAAITLAEELNFTRTAERLGITQPALSKRIAELESFLGFHVFKRVQKRVELTDAGQFFIRGCRDAHAILERSIRTAKTAHDEIKPVINVGHSPYADPLLIAAMLGVHLPLYPTLRLRIESMFASDLAHAVMVSELDVALITEPAANSHLTQVLVATHPLCAVMPGDHPAARKPAVSLDDIGPRGWMVFPRKSHSAIYERLMNEARTAGVSPVELHHYVSPQECLQLIYENFGVAFMAKGVAEQLRGQDIAVRPLTHSSLQVGSYLVLRAEESSRLINDFGRAFLRKVLPLSKLEASSGQLQLGL